MIIYRNTTFKITLFQMLNLQTSVMQVMVAYFKINCYNSIIAYFNFHCLMLNEAHVLIICEFIIKSLIHSEIKQRVINHNKSTGKSDHH